MYDELLYCLVLNVFPCVLVVPDSQQPSKPEGFVQLTFPTPALTPVPVPSQLGGQGVY